jgi:hypothetical protein
MTREEIADLVSALPEGLDADEFIYKLVNWAVDREREACAKVCEEISDSAHALWKVDADPTEQGRDIGAEHCAQAIRLRGEK